MKTSFLIPAIALVFFCSCSTMYKSVQTPDDVYYSPARSYQPVEERDNREERNQSQQVNNYNGEDRMIRMGITNSRWRMLNNDYGYSPYNYSIYTNPYNSNLFNNPYNYNNYGLPNSHFYYNDYYYNPYYSPYPMYPVYLNPVTLPKNTTPRTTNLAGYGRGYNNSNSIPVRSAPASKSSGSYNNSNNSRRSGLGEILNKVFAPAPGNTYNNNNNNNNTNNNNTQQRTYTPPPASSNTNSSSSSGNSGNSGGRISRPN